MKKNLLLLFSCLVMDVYSQHFEPTFASLQQYQCPEWIQKAKFGINCHWNAQSASKSANSGWYAREMYVEGSPAYKDHLKNWGHPSEVGYKDVVMSWKADKFDAKQWVSLFKEAGAKFILTMAVHHDNFDMWKSKYQPRWNSMNYGPKVDVCKAIREETLKAGLRWGVTTHLERTYSWVQANKGADKKGPKAGIPYDGNMKEYEDLYLEYPDFKNLGPEFYHYRSPLVSPQSWKEHLQSLDFLKHATDLRRYGQRDPLNEYKREAFLLFSEMLARVREQVTVILTHAQQLAFHPVKEVETPEGEKINFSKIGRNELCPCGSGKKFKHCHGAIA